MPHPSAPVPPPPEAPARNLRPQKKSPSLGASKAAAPKPVRKHPIKSAAMVQDTPPESEEGTSRHGNSSYSRCMISDSTDRAPSPTGGLGIVQKMLPPPGRAPAPPAIVIFASASNTTSRSGSPLPGVSSGESTAVEGEGHRADIDELIPDSQESTSNSRTLANPRNSQLLATTTSVAHATSAQGPSNAITAR